MMRLFVEDRSFQGLIFAGLIGLIAGLPYFCIAANSHPVVLTAIEDATVGNCGPPKSDFPDVDAFFSEVESAAAPAFWHRVADEWAESEPVLTESHLQRGPPAC
jgi:hypothetical protein